MYLRNEADSAWIEVATIDQANNEWQITTGVVQAKDSDGLALKTDDGTTRVKVDDSGNFLVGTTDTTPYNNNAGTAADQGFVVNDGRIFAATNANSVSILNRTSTDGTIQDFRKDGSTVGSIGVVSGGVSLGSGDTGLFFEPVSNEIRPFNTSTNASIDDAINLGNSSKRFKDLYLSGGVYLGGTGSANQLDDYEEGTWTPNAYQGTTTTYITQTGTYVKIGKLVHILGRLTISSLGNGSAQRIGGLPFANDNEHTLNISKLSGSSSNFYSIYLRTSGSTLYGSSQNNLDGTIGTNINYLTNGTEIQFSGTYETT